MDVKAAHRLPPVRRQDWKFLACRAAPGEEIFINTVGTFGVASAAYWWARVAGGFVRLVHYAVGLRAVCWALLMADDLDLEFSSSANSKYNFRIAFFVFF